MSESPSGRASARASPVPLVSRAISAPRSRAALRSGARSISSPVSARTGTVPETTSHPAERCSISSSVAVTAASHRCAASGGAGALTLVVEPAASMIDVFTRVAPGTGTMRSSPAWSRLSAKATSSSPITTTATVPRPAADNAAATLTPLPLTSRSYASARTKAPVRSIPTRYVASIAPARVSVTMAFLPPVGAALMPPPRR